MQLSDPNLEIHLFREMVATEYERQRPSVLWRPELSRDGNKYFVLYGPNVQQGCAGFGDSPEEAMRDFDKNWTTKLPTQG